MLEQLFSSNTRIKLLRLFLNHPSSAYYVREISRKIDEHLNSVRRELENLETMGFLAARHDNEKKYFSVNPEFILFPEIKALFLKSSMLTEDQLVKKIQALGQVYYLMLSGVFTGDTKADVDMLIVGHLPLHDLRNVVKHFEQELEKDIRYTVFSLKEFNERRQLTDRFLYHALNGKKVEVINKLGI